jgi:hypothetical protein
VPADMGKHERPERPHWTTSFEADKAAFESVGWPRVREKEKQVLDRLATPRCTAVMPAVKAFGQEGKGHGNRKLS